LQRGRHTQLSQNETVVLLFADLLSTLHLFGRRAQAYAASMISLILSLLISPFSQAEIHLEKIKLPPGFKIEVFVDKIKNARSMTWGSKGTLFVGSQEAGNVYAVTPQKKIFKIATRLNMPNGVAFKDGALYVAEIDKLWKYDNIEDHLDHPPKPVLLRDDYPKDAHHGWKFIAFGPDGKLYVPVGAPCNICDPKEAYASITRLSPDGKTRDIYARGIRNTVGFDWHPVTKELWFTDNGADTLGDDFPSDELNHAPKPGMHFGYPYCHEGSTLDKEFGKGKKCSDYTPPVVKLGAHVASLGMRFYTGNSFPPEYKNQIFIAEHGSWNRTKKSGYRVVSVTFGKDGKAESSKPFAEGWLQGEENWGRPVDVIVAADGSLLVSDDFANAIYKISSAGK
jgi:glucose/arabinose dehydrogenase